jgi:cell division septum initiation protein DivIVA
MTVRDQDPPEFSYGIRGYDRLQVDEYVARLREYAADIEDQAIEAGKNGNEAEHRVAQLRRELDAAKAQEDQLRVELAESSGENLPPRLAQILQLARDEADDIRQHAREDANRTFEQTHTDVKELLDNARGEAERIVGAALADELAIRDRIADLLVTKRALLADLVDLEGIARDAIARHATDAAAPLPDVDRREERAAEELTT